MKAGLSSLLLLLLVFGQTLSVSLKFWEWFKSAPAPPTALELLKAMNKPLFQDNLDKIDDYLSNLGDEVDSIDRYADKMKLEGAELIGIIRQIIEYGDAQLAASQQTTTSTSAKNQTTNSTTSTSGTKLRILSDTLLKSVAPESTLIQKASHLFMKLYDYFDALFPDPRRPSVKIAFLDKQLSSSSHQRLASAARAHMEQFRSLEDVVRERKNAHLASEDGEMDIIRWNSQFNYDDNTPKFSENLLKKTLEMRSNGEALINVLKPIPEE